MEREVIDGRIRRASQHLEMSCACILHCLTHPGKPLDRAWASGGRAFRAGEYARTYQITHEQLAELDATQTCPICGAPFPFTLLEDRPKKTGPHCPHLDHDHSTGRVRGVLCASCNASLGHVEKQLRAGRLEKMLRYLKGEENT